MSSEDKAREDVIWGVKTMCRKGYVCATGGNISARIEGTDWFVITPSGRDYETMTKDDLVVVNLADETISGEFKPSIEINMHRLIYINRTDINCIVHMHSKFAVAAASLEGMHGIPPFDFELLVYFGGAIPFAPFAVLGTMDLAKIVVESMGDSMGVIMANHGAIGVGKTMKDAMTKCDIIEKSCEAYLAILAAGEVNPIPEEVINKFKGIA
jgi:L-ribulose-5-phosphate 4-epimerase